MTTLVHMGQPPSLASAHCSHHTVTDRSDGGQLGGLVGAVWWQAVRGQLEGHASHSSHFLVGGVAALLDGWDINVRLGGRGLLAGWNVNVGLEGGYRWLAGIEIRMRIGIVVCCRCDLQLYTLLN